MGSNTLTWCACGLLFVAAIAFMVIGEPERALGISDSELARLVTGTALLIVIGSSLAMSYKGQGSLALKQAVLWLGMAMALVVGYTYRAEFEVAANRVMGELLPGTPVALRTPNDNYGSNGIVAITAERGGQFSISTMVNDTHVEMILDTGATHVVLTDFDARRIGIDLTNISYRVPVRTANGTTHTAQVKLEEISVGPISVSGVRALIAKPDDLEVSLLGMSFLKTLSSFEIKGDQVVLRQ